MINGILNVYKEAGYTSHDVVAKLRGILRQKKIGHTGTLDPDARGVLPVCLGSGTRLCGMLTDKDKEYVAELLLGVKTDTQDCSGRVLEQRPVLCSEEQARQTAESFLGGYLQVPPMYSALKVDGKRLYELARAGREVERRARAVVIRELEILELCLPVVKMRVVCSRGTYIRTLCEDIGDKLGCGGCMKSLLRTRVGDFRAEEAFTLERLEELRDQGKLEDVVTAVDAVFRECPALHMKEEFTPLLLNGNAVPPAGTVEETVLPAGQNVRMYDNRDVFHGIYAYDQERLRYRPVKMFPSL